MKSMNLPDVNGLYAELVRDTWKLRAESSLELDDIKQELYLLCMEVAEGRSKYTPELGSVHDFIMGRLWGLMKRWPQSISLDEGSDETNHVPATLHAPSIEDVLEDRDALYAQDLVDIEENRRLRDRMKNYSTLAILVQTKHWSLREAAKFCGMSYGSIYNLVAIDKAVQEGE